jgi:SNF2 family DNA or RNA helicase
MLDIGDLYESQQRGVDHLYESDATQFVAPMGFGKTAVAMTAVSELIEHDVIDCALTIAPKRVAEVVWPDEAKNWKHLRHLRVRTITGNRTEREAKLLGLDADIYVIGIDHVPWLVEQLDKLPDGHRLLDCLIVDELSRLKSPRGKWSKVLRKAAHRFKIRWGLTGTPRPNGYLDQFAPLGVISANKLWGKLFDPWREKHFMATDFQRHNWVIRPEHQAKIEADIGQYTVTVDNSDMPDLPKVITRDHWITLPGHLRSIYDEMEKKLAADVAEGTIVAANAGVATIKLAQIAQGFLYGELATDTTYLHTAKLDALRELVEALDGDPVLIVYEFQEDIAMMRRWMPDLCWLGHSTTEAETRRYIEAWNAGNLPVLALHPAAAGHGLNLQKGGNQMIWYGMTWSPELYAQTIARLHRQGQTQHVFVHRILAQDTVDIEKVLRVEGKITAQDVFNSMLRRI